MNSLSNNFSKHYSAYYAFLGMLAPLNRNTEPSLEKCIDVTRKLFAEYETESADPTSLIEYALTAIEKKPNENMFQAIKQVVKENKSYEKLAKRIENISLKNISDAKNQQAPSQRKPKDSRFSGAFLQPKTEEKKLLSKESLGIKTSVSSLKKKIQDLFDSFDKKLNDYKGSKEYQSCVKGILPEKKEQEQLEEFMNEKWENIQANATHMLKKMTDEGVEFSPEMMDLFQQYFCHLESLDIQFNRWIEKGLLDKEFNRDWSDKTKQYLEHSKQKYLEIKNKYNDFESNDWPNPYIEPDFKSYISNSNLHANSKMGVKAYLKLMQKNPLRMMYAASIALNSADGADQLCKKLQEMGGASRKYGRYLQEMLRLKSLEKQYIIQNGFRITKNENLIGLPTISEIKDYLMKQDYSN